MMFSFSFFLAFTWLTTHTVFETSNRPDNICRMSQRRKNLYEMIIFHALYDRTRVENKYSTEAEEEKLSSQQMKIYARIHRRHGLVLLKVGNQMKIFSREMRREFSCESVFSALVRFFTLRVLFVVGFNLQSFEIRLNSLLSHFGIV